MLYNFRIKFKDNSSIPQILKDVKAVEPLIKALKDESPGVRWRTAEALGEIKDVKAMEPSNRLLNVPTSVVKDVMRKR